MSYTHGQTEQRIVTAASNNLATAAVLGQWGPGYRPVLVRALMVLMQEAANDACVVEFNKRPTFGAASGEAAIGTMTLTAAAAGSVQYVELDPPVKVSPGEAITFEVVTDTTTAGEADASIFIEPAHESPANNSDMVVRAS